MEAVRSAPRRLVLVDFARGTAVLAMILYHFTWDLGFFRIIDYDVTGEPGGRLAARLIAGTFLVLVGISLVLANRQGFDRRRYLRRLVLIAGAAALVTLGTWYAMPEGLIFFGILHCIAVSSVLALPFLRWPVAVAIVAALASFAMPLLLTGPAFANPVGWVLGLSPSLPHTNDYVPIFPWFGAVLGGIALARLALPRLGTAMAERPAPKAGPLRWLDFAGRHSLPIYLIHQPLLIGTFYGLLSLGALGSGPAEPGREGFEGGCRAACLAGKTEASVCRQMCACVATELSGTSLLTRDPTTPLDEGDQQRVAEAVGICRAGASAPP
jgi:uncharacterized membrane protein